VAGATVPPKAPSKKKATDRGIFFVYSLQVLLSDERNVSSKTLQKTFYKQIVSKSFYQSIEGLSLGHRPSDSLLSRFWAFLGEGSKNKKTIKKLDKKSDQSWYFFGL
jgi:hypothetical protein